MTFITKVECPDCSVVRIPQVTPEFILEIPIFGHPDLQSAVSFFFEPEEVSVSCTPECGSQLGVKTVCIDDVLQLPASMIVAVQRREFNRDGTFSISNQDLDFDYDLTFFDCQGGDRKYQISAIVTHGNMIIGENGESQGHYVAFVWQQSFWWLKNDSRSYPVEMDGDFLKHCRRQSTLFVYSDVEIVEPYLPLDLSEVLPRYTLEIWPSSEAVQAAVDTLTKLWNDHRGIAGSSHPPAADAPVVEPESAVSEDSLLTARSRRRIVEDPTTSSPVPTLGNNNNNNDDNYPF